MSERLNLEGKRAVITGGTRGIGLAIAKTFLEAGASVVLFGRNPETGKKAIEELQSSANGRVCSFLQVDVADGDQVKEGIEKALELLGGGIEILVNNAGITRDQLLLRMGETDWDQVIDTNLKSVYQTSRAVLRPMIKSRIGTIINITSVVGRIGNAGQTNYAASKAGMVGFSQSLAKEVASRGIRVNCIAPGMMQTDMTDVLTDKQKQNLLDQIPMRRLGEPEEIANAALFLASDLAKYLTGQVITVDGGMVMC